MKDKFIMNLVWHNCKTYPPQELYNTFLLATNGGDVHITRWHRAEGYEIVTADGYEYIKYNELEEWYWADIRQTVQTSQEFIKIKGEIK